MMLENPPELPSVFSSAIVGKARNVWQVAVNSALALEKGGWRGGIKQLFQFLETTTMKQIY